MNYEQKVKDFLNQKIIAVAGVSRKPKGEVGNPIYKKFRTAGYTVYPINPFADQIEGDKCYPTLSATPKKADAVFIATSPAASLNVVKQCIENGISRIWFHRSFGNGSFSEEAAKLGEEKGSIRHPRRMSDDVYKRRRWIPQDCGFLHENFWKALLINLVV